MTGTNYETFLSIQLPFTSYVLSPKILLSRSQISSIYFKIFYDLMCKLQKYILTVRSETKFYTHTQ